MSAWPLLSLLIWLPIAGGFATLWFGRGRADQARWFALLVAVVTLVLSTCLYTGFDPASASMQFAETREWIPSYDIWYSLGVDGISIARSEEHTSELQSLMRISYAVFCLKKKKNYKQNQYINTY